MDIPKDKNYPAGAGQCNDCGGHGCQTCDQKGWLKARHPKIRRCMNEGCDKPLDPDWVPVYCSNSCAMIDA